MVTTYEVTWISSLVAENPNEAAKYALKALQSEDNRMTIFQVKNERTGHVVLVDAETGRQV